MEIDKFLCQPGVNGAAVSTARFAGVPMVSRAIDALRSVPRGLIPLGSVEFCRAYARLHGVELQNPETYPERLLGYLGRHVRVTQFGFAAGDRFVKPVNCKAFTGGIKQHLDEFVKPGELVYESEVVEFVAEWRCYVLGGRILGIAQYGEGDDAEPPVDDVCAMVEAYQRQSGYALDVGRLASGKVVLVEVNDAWALGFYRGTCTGADYLTLVATRWREMMEASHENR